MIVAVVAITMFFWAFSTVGKSFFRWLESRQDEGAGSSLRTSELEAIIERAVREATRPLEDKVERLESRLERRELPPADYEHDEQNAERAAQASREATR